MRFLLVIAAFALVGAAIIIGLRYGKSTPEPENTAPPTVQTVSPLRVYAEENLEIGQSGVGTITPEDLNRTPIEVGPEYFEVEIHYDPEKACVKIIPGDFTDNNEIACTEEITPDSPLAQGVSLLRCEWK